MCSKPYFVWFLSPLTALPYSGRKKGFHNEALCYNVRLHLNDSPLESRDEHVRERGEGGFTNLGVSQILESDIAHT